MNLHRLVSPAVGLFLAAIAPSLVHAQSVSNTPPPPNAQAFDQSPLQVSTKGSIFIVQLGNSATLVGSGYVNLDQPTALNCKNASGCLVMFGADVQTQNRVIAVCGFIDQVIQASPTCSTGIMPVTVNRQAAVISQGGHTVQTELYLAGSGNQQIGTWETEYTMYDLPKKKGN